VNGGRNTTSTPTLPAGNIRRIAKAGSYTVAWDVFGTPFASSQVNQHAGSDPAEMYTRSGSMNENEFQGKLAELMGEISTLPATERAKLEKIATETRARHERLRATVSSLQESLDYLRLSIKYLVFDLEATRRENGYLRKMLEETSGND
jgi:hypothetical protein